MVEGGGWPGRDEEVKMRVRSADLPTYQEARLKPDVIACTCDPSYSRGGGRAIENWRSPWVT